MRREHGDHVEELPGLPTELRGPSEDRVADGLGHVGLPRRQHLRHEERVAVRLSKEVIAVDALRRGELGDSRGGERLHVDSQSLSAQLAEHGPQRMPAVDFVIAVGRHDEQRNRRHRATEEAQDVEGCFVGPMDVLDYEQDRRRPVDMGEERGGELVGFHVCCDESLQLLVLGRDLEERRKRARGQK